MNDNPLRLIALIIMLFLCVLVFSAVTDGTYEERNFKTCIEAGIDKTECAEILKPACKEEK